MFGEHLVSSPGITTVLMTVDDKRVKSTGVDGGDDSWKK